MLPDWECLGGLPIVAIYRKTKPRLSPTNAFVSHLAREFKRYDDVMPAASVAAVAPGALARQNSGFRVWHEAG